ncbi:MAG: YggT family protein [Deltaproteobacteria bacterium]|nr:YggT family protein [Deltaproteobacteria bacterium]
MFVVGNLINALAIVIDTVLNIYMWIVIISTLISWVNPDPYNPIIRFLYGITEPLFAFVRRHLPIPQMGIDFSPLIVILAIVFLRAFVVNTLFDIAKYR